MPAITKKDNTASYSEKELTKLITSSSSEVVAILADMTSSLTGLKDQLKKVDSVVQSLPKDLDMGVSLLDLKAQCLLSYNELLLAYILLKLEGVDLKDHPLFASLVRARYSICTAFTCRTLIEKLEPLELKMKSYIDTVVNPQQDTSTSNPLAFHANMDDFNVSSSEEETESTKPKKDNVYRPPKIAAVLYTEKGVDCEVRVRSRC